MCRLDELDLFTRTEGFNLLKISLGIPKKAKLHRAVFDSAFQEIDFGGKYISPIENPRVNIPKICAENKFPEKIHSYFKMLNSGRPEAKFVGQNLLSEIQNSILIHQKKTNHVTAPNSL